MTNNELFSRYAIVKQQLQSLESEEKLLKEALLEEFTKNNQSKVETVYGKFTVSGKKNWVYSNKVKELSDKVKLLQYEEQEKKIATCNETKYILFTPVKIK